MEEFLTSTLQTTFSIAVAAYLLIRMEKRLDELAIAINNLEKGVAKYFGEV
ncbi:MULTISPECIES: YvrJ family protein [Acetomicrobium]|uniref:YvrJ protein family protein n=1 Tax=Acetomicrobium thermoterrenum DSM 13490 TaxID=1120987 RepID=A0A1H3FFL6_9BACT|nr:MULTISPECIES: YvrJ family protein [Acetomicrobium]SDX89740.1 YvrJ protein family protein [Acetomicrobium thermoterrenum DSM 13490]